MTADEVRALLSETHDYTASFAVAFVKIEDKEEDALPAGSGTLVAAGGCHAILTADHVLDALPKEGEFGIVFPTVGSHPLLHRYRVDVANVHKITIGKASYDRNGPDLGLVVLGYAEYSKLQALKSFYNIGTRRQRMRDEAPPIEQGGWFLVGMATEWTSDLPPEHGFSRVKGFRGLCGAGVVVSERTTDSYDYLDFEAKYNNAYEGPKSYQGFSGGGLWQIRLKEEGGQLRIAETLLSGVAFYESEIIGDIRTIYCHGRRSVYRLAFDALVGAKTS